MDILKRNVPDFFVNGGKKITSLKEWESYRSAIKDLFLKEEYGYLPEK